MLLPFTFMAKGLLPPVSGEALACPVRRGFKEQTAGWDLGRQGGPGIGQVFYPSPCFDLNPSHLFPGSSDGNGSTYSYSLQRPPRVG